MFPAANDSYHADRLATVVGPIVPLVLWGIAGMQVLGAPLYWYGVTPTQSRSVAGILLACAVGCVVLGWLIRQATRRSDVSAAGIASVSAVTLLASSFSLASYLTDLGVTIALPYCVLVGVAATPFWLRRRHFLAGLAGCFLPPLILALESHPSAVERSFVVQISAVAVVASLGIFLLMRRTSMRAHLMAAELAHRAAYDGLTGALNRTTWIERAGARLARDQRRNEVTSCLFVDMDGFKQVNDIHGHEAGDAILGSVAEVLRRLATVDGDHLVGRIGGDEFVVLLAGTGADEARRVAARVQHALRSLAGVPIQPSASIGVAISTPTDTLAALVRRADLTMLDVKASHRHAGSRVWVPDPAGRQAVASVG